jgi:hypothetical protein
MHRSGSKHSNVDALNKNPIGHAEEDDDFLVKIQDCNWL